MKVWMSNTTKNKTVYAKRNILLVYGGVFLAILLMFTGIVITERLGLPQDAVSGILLVSVSAALIFMAVRLGMANGKDTLIFCQDENYKMYVINAFSLVPYRRGAMGFLSMSNKIQALLNQIKNEKLLEAYMMTEDGLSSIAARILWVDKIRSNPKSHTVICRVCEPDGTTRRSHYIIRDGYDRQEELLMALQAKIRGQFWEWKPDYNPLGIFLSAVVLTACIVVCVLSHAKISILPASCYYPCMMFAFVPLFGLLYFVIRHVRGE